MSPIRPYTIRVSQTEVDKLNQKLAVSEFPNELEDAGRDYGAPLREVKRLVTFWKDVFKWSVVEKEMNKLPNFETTIDVDGFGPLDIHFLHEVSSVKTAIPLLFVHGCTFTLALKMALNANFSRAGKLLRSHATSSPLARKHQEPWSSISRCRDFIAEFCFFFWSYQAWLWSATLL